MIPLITHFFVDIIIFTLIVGHDSKQNVMLLFCLAKNTDDNCEYSKYCILSASKKMKINSPFLKKMNNIYFILFHKGVGTERGGGGGSFLSYFYKTLIIINQRRSDKTCKISLSYIFFNPKMFNSWIMLICLFFGAALFDRVGLCAAQLRLSINSVQTKSTGNVHYDITVYYKPRKYLLIYLLVKLTYTNLLIKNNKCYYLQF